VRSFQKLPRSLEINYYGKKYQKHPLGKKNRKNASEKLNSVEVLPRENFTNQKALRIFCRKTYP